MLGRIQKKIRMATSPVSSEILMYAKQLRSETGVYSITLLWMCGQWNFPLTYFIFFFPGRRPASFQTFYTTALYISRVTKQEFVNQLFEQAFLIKHL